MNFRITRVPKGLSWLIVALAVTSGLAYTVYGPPRLADGLRYEVFADGLQNVSALAFDPEGGLFATLEMKHGQGRVIRIDQGHISTVLSNLEKPDGILLRGDTLYVTNEGGSHGLLVYESGKVRYVDGVMMAEGIASAGGDKLLVVEDKEQVGRLLSIDPNTDKIEVLLRGLNRSEGVCQSPSGRIYFVERERNRLSYYADGKGVIAATGLEQPGYLQCLPDESILITEDRKRRGRLLRYSERGVEVLARNLHAPQAVIVGSDGAYYLSEQRKKRILRIYRP